MKTRGLIILPSYNEGPTVVTVCAALRREIPAVDLLVVDDGSSDATASLLKEAGLDYVRHPRNLGYIEALRSGLAIALEEQRPFVCFCDADGQHRIEDVRQMINYFLSRETTAPLDILAASRFLSGTGKPTSKIRGIGNHIFCRLLQLLTGRTFTDVSNGLKILSPRAAQHMSTLPLEDAHAELLLSAIRGGLTVEEHPVIILPRTQGKSMITFLKALWYPLRTTLALLILYSRTEK